MDFGKPAYPELREYTVGAIRKESDALRALVADVRAAAERDDFKVKPRPVLLLALLREARAYAETLPGDHQVGVSLGAAGEGTVVRADAGRIGQVLRNLLSNAARHSPDGTHIELRIAGVHEERIRVEVADHTGPVYIRTTSVGSSRSSDGDGMAVRAPGWVSGCTSAGASC